jgi:hypothetical protein
MATTTKGDTMNTYTVRNRKTGQISTMQFANKVEAWKYLITNHGTTWDRRYSIVLVPA